MLGGVSALAADPLAPAPDPLTLNLKDADIRAFIGSMSELTHKNFVVDPRVQGKVTVISAVPTDPEALYQVFLSILKVNGFVAIPNGGVIKIIPEALAKSQENADAGERAASIPPDAFVTRVIELKHVKASVLLPVLQPLMAADAHIAGHDESNTLVVADTRASIDRLERIIARIDQKVDRSVEVITLQHANAEDVVRTLTTLHMGNEQGGGVPISVAADMRSNSVLLGGDPDQRLQLRALVSHLDTPINATDDTEVIYLHYAAAEDLAKILQNAGAKITDPQSGKAGGGTASPVAGNGSGTQPAGDMLVQADKATNALVIQAPPEKLKRLKAIVQALDVRRAQVFVEGIIAEISNTHASELGVQWRTHVPKSEGILGGVVLSGTGTNSIVGSALSAAPTTLASGFSLGFLSGGTLRSLLQMLSSSDYANVLSTPSLVTLDNEEAEIVVGQNVPFVTGQYTSTGTGQGVTNPFQTVERQDVGVLLKVKPQINEGNAVRLTISQEVSSVDTAASTAGSLTTNKRSIKTNVLVDDGQTIVIGGLIKDSVERNTQKVPLVGDLPLLGNFFRDRRNDSGKTNLMVFLRPTILRDAQTAGDLTMGKYSAIRALQHDTPDDRIALMPGVPVPKLPELHPLPPPKGPGLPHAP